MAYLVVQARLGKKAEKFEKKVLTKVRCSDILIERLTRGTERER